MCTRIVSEVTVKTDLLPRELAPRRVKAAGVLFSARANTALSPNFHTGRTLPPIIRRSVQIPDATLLWKMAFDNKITVANNFTSYKVSTSRPTSTVSLARY